MCRRCWVCCDFIVFFFNDTATTEIYTLSLHDALPIYLSPTYARDDKSLESVASRLADERARRGGCRSTLASYGASRGSARDRKSTRLNSSHSQISYAVFCLKKKKSNTHSERCHQVIRA